MTLHEKFDTLSAYRSAIDRVIQQARCEVRIFDYNLADGGYDGARRSALLGDFLLADRGNRLVIVLHETDYLTKSCPRLINLLARFSHAIQVNRTLEHARDEHAPLVVADGRHFAARFHYDQPRGLLALDDYEQCTPLMQKFDEILASSEPAVSATTLGL